MSAESSTLVSVVAIGRNEGDRLRRCLQSVAAMNSTGFKTETIYVDSGSVDGSVETSRVAGAHTISLHAERPTAALGRNAGWQQAQGEFVLFMDGDTILAPDFVTQALEAMQNAEVAVVWGHRREIDAEGSIYNRVLDLDWIYAPGKTEFCGGDALFRRSILQETGGFDGTLIAGEEPELCRRILGRRGIILHLDVPMTGHDLAITRFNQYWKRATRAGHAFAEVSSRFAETDHPFWLDDVRRNRNRALMLMTLPVLALAAAIVLRQVWPLAVALGLLSLLVVRTAWKARWKSREVGTLLAYGLHSHLQQIPIYLGQLRFRRNQRRGQRTALVEYKRF